MRFHDVDTMSVEVVEMIRGREEWRERITRLFNEHHMRLYRFALRLATDEGGAKDLVQDAFVRAACNPSSVPYDTDQALSWLIRVVVNLARDRYRRELVRAAFRRLRHPFAHDPTEALDARSSVRAALRSLPPRQRAVVALHYLDGEPVPAIAETLRLAPATVRWHLATARKRLAAFLATKGNQ